jgi:hypothetical protein
MRKNQAEGYNFSFSPTSALKFSPRYSYSKAIYMASFGFSVGDFINVINIAREIVSAINDTRGSTREFLSLNSELYSLEQVLIAIKSLEQRENEARLFAALDHAINLCRLLIDDFVKGIAKYQPCLRLNGSSSQCKDLLRKVQWRFNKKTDIVRLRAEIGSHTRSIQMLMSRILM